MQYVLDKAFQVISMNQGNKYSEVCQRFLKK